MIVYRDKLFLPSESFIPRAYSYFAKLRPIHVGYGDCPGPDHVTAIRLSDSDSLSQLDHARFRVAGHVPDAMRQALAEIQPEVIHAHFGKSGAYALPLAEALDLPLVVTFHGGDAAKHVHYRPNPLAVFYRRKSKLFRQAHSLLAVSDFVRRKLIERGAPAEKIIVLHNGVDPERFRPSAKKREILFIGRMVEKKGIDVLAEGLVQLGDQLEGWTVRLLGDGPLRGSAEAAFSRSAADCRFEGWIAADKVPEYLGTAAIVVVPSRTAKSGDAEGLPMTVMEAMMSGCAVIGANHAGIPDAVSDGETGFIFPEGDSRKLSEQLAKLLSDFDLTLRFGKAGRARAQAHFNSEIQSRKLEAHLLTAIAEHALPRGDHRT